MQVTPRPQGTFGFASAHVIEDVRTLMTSRHRRRVLLDLKRGGPVTTGPVVVKEDGGWRLYAGAAELQLGAWSVRQNGESLVLVLDGFDPIGEERFKFL